MFCVHLTKHMKRITRCFSKQCHGSMPSALACAAHTGLFCKELCVSEPQSRCMKLPTFPTQGSAPFSPSLHLHGNTTWPPGAALASCLGSCTGSYAPPAPCQSCQDSRPNTLLPGDSSLSLSSCACSLMLPGLPEGPQRSQRAHGAQVSEAAPSAAAQAPAAPPPTEPIVISVTEKVMVALNKDGGVRDMEVQGSMLLQARPLLPSSCSGVKSRVWGLRAWPTRCRPVLGLDVSLPTLGHP